MPLPKPATLKELRTIMEAIGGAQKKFARPAEKAFLAKDIPVRIRAVFGDAIPDVLPPHLDIEGVHPDLVNLLLSLSTASKNKTPLHAVLESATPNVKVLRKASTMDSTADAEKYIKNIFPVLNKEVTDLVKMNKKVNKIPSKGKIRHLVDAVMSSDPSTVYLGLGPTWKGMEKAPPLEALMTLGHEITHAPIIASRLRKDLYRAIPRISERFNSGLIPESHIPNLLRGMTMPWKYIERNARDEVLADIPTLKVLKRLGLPRLLSLSKSDIGHEVLRVLRNKAPIKGSQEELEWISQMELGHEGLPEYLKRLRAWHKHGGVQFTPAAGLAALTAAGAGVGAASIYSESDDAS